MKLNRSVIAVTSLVVGAASLAHADAYAYSEANVYTTWFDAGPDLVVDVSTSGYSDLYDYFGPSFGDYSNSPVLTYDTNNNYTSVSSTADGSATTSYLVGQGTLYFIYDNSSTPENITFYTTGYASGDTAISGATDIAGYDSFAGLALEQGPTTSYVDYTVSGGWDTGYESSSYTAEDTITVQPGVETFFESVSYTETVVYSTDSRATPGPTGALPFGVGLLWRSRAAKRLIPKFCWRPAAE